MKFLSVIILVIFTGQTLSRPTCCENCRVGTSVFESFEQNFADDCADKHICRITCKEYIGDNSGICKTIPRPDMVNFVDISMIFQNIPRNEPEQAQKQKDRNFIKDILSGKLFRHFKNDPTSKHFRLVYARYARINTDHIENGQGDFTLVGYKNMIVQMLKRGDQIQEIYFLDALSGFQRLLDSFKDFCKKKRLSTSEMEEMIESFLRNPSEVDPRGHEIYTINANRLTSEWKTRLQGAQKELIRYFVDNYERRDYAPCNGVTYWWGITRYWESLRGQVNLRSPQYVADIERWIQSVKDIVKQTCCPVGVLAQKIDGIEDENY